MSKHFVLLDAGQTITAYSYSDSAPGPEWVQVSSIPTLDGAVLGTRKRLVDEAIVDTGQSIIPPATYMDWDEIGLAWVVNVSRAWANVRNERDQKLAASDWTTLPDVPMSAEKRAEWAIYRQALRDVTEQPDPTAIEWPVAPE